jgi:nuclear pore complex protein Nup93
VSVPTTGPPSLSLTTLIWRYVRQFVKMDAKEALQYVYCVCLSAEQVENAWELVRRIIVLANAGAAWEELVGGLRPDGTRFVSPQSLSLTEMCTGADSVRCSPASSSKARRS